jgi:HSP20 family protein
MMLAPRKLFEHEKPLSRLFDDVFGDERTSRFLPALDIEENEDAFLVTAEIPGVDPQAVEITVDRDVLTLKGEKKEEESGEKNGRHYSERRFGSFVRRFSLPESADAGSVSAESRDGILRITIAKKAETKPRQIPIQS